MRRNYLHYLFFLALLTACLVMCLPVCNQSSATPVEDAGAPDCDNTACVLPEKRTEFAQENWRFTVPGEEWITTKPPADELKVMVRNQNKEAMVVFLKEPTDDSMAAYVIGTLRAFASEGNTISSAKQVVINQTKYVKAQIDSQPTTIWVWITVKDGYGYSLACGGDYNPEAGATLHDLCDNIATTL